MTPDPKSGNIWNTTHKRIKAANLASEITGQIMQDNSERFQDEDESIEYYRELRENIYWDLESKE